MQELSYLQYPRVRWNKVFHSFFVAHGPRDISHGVLVPSRVGGPKSHHKKRREKRRRLEKLFRGPVSVTDVIENFIKPGDELLDNAKLCNVKFLRDILRYIHRSILQRPRETSANDLETSFSLFEVVASFGDRSRSCLRKIRYFHSHFRCCD